MSVVNNQADIGGPTKRTLDAGDSAAFGEQGERFVWMTIAAFDADVEAGIRAIFDWVGKQ